ncbi:hypothetical protein HZ320_02240 [[Pasteurella] aerogenes]|nr:hypothetical protein HZ320_02240 [[Pasteurella] aerogenes]
MKKPNADSLALLFARDIARTASASNSSPVSQLNEYKAEEIANFVETLSKRFEALDDSVSVPAIINAYKSQSDK